RPAKDARITIFSARPGVVIGKKGEEIEALKAELRRLMGVNQVHVNIEEIRKPEVDAQLIADSIAQQLEKRIMFRRAMKRAMQNAMRLGAEGAKSCRRARRRRYCRRPRRRRSPKRPRSRGGPRSRCPSRAQGAPPAGRGPRASARRRRSPTPPRRRPR